MRTIVHFFIELALLRRAPQDLPAASALFLLVLLAGLTTSLLLAGSAGSSLTMGLLQAVLEQRPVERCIDFKTLPTSESLSLFP